MNKQERISKAIKDVISEMMERVMERVLITDPFIKEKIMPTMLCHIILTVKKKIINGLFL